MEDRDEKSVILEKRAMLKDKKRRYKMGRALIMILFVFVFAGTVFSQQMKNPFAGNQQLVKEGADIFKKHCEGCHGAGGKGDICPDLTKKSKKYGNTDADLYLTISKGRPGGMPNWDNTLGKERIWKVITYIRSIEK